MMIYQISTNVVFWIAPGVGHLPSFLASTLMHLTNFFVPTSRNLFLLFNKMLMVSARGGAWAPLDLTDALPLMDRFDSFWIFN